MSAFTDLKFGCTYKFVIETPDRKYEAVVKIHTQMNPKTEKAVGRIKNSTHNEDLSGKEFRIHKDGKVVISNHQSTSDNKIVDYEKID